MLVACWSAKGGVGTTVVAASLALLLARRAARASCSPISPATARPSSACPSPTAPASPAGWRPATTCPPTRSRGSRSRRLRAWRSCLGARGRSLPGRARGAGRAARPWAATGRGRLRCDDRAGRGGRRGRRRPAVAPGHPALLPGAAPGHGIPLRPSEVVLVREPGRALSRHDVERPSALPVRGRDRCRPGGRPRRRRRAAGRPPAPLVANGGCAMPRDRRDRCRRARRPRPRRLLESAADRPLDDAGSDRRSCAGRRRCSAPSQVAGVVARVRARIGGLGPLEPLLADPPVTEVMVNGPGPVWVERAGRLERTDVELDRAAIDLLVERVVAPLGLRADRASPVVDARLPDGSRVHVVVPPLAVDGPGVTIRRFGAAAIRPRRVLRPRRRRSAGGAVDAGPTWSSAAARAPARPRCSTRLCGPARPASGSSPSRTPPSCACPASTSCGSRPARRAPTALGAVGVRDLVRNALRMRPDRIVVGEVRGAEALDMLQAMNTGHEGSLSTCHANGPADALRRLETMVLMGRSSCPSAAVREQVLGASTWWCALSGCDRGTAGGRSCRGRLGARSCGRHPALGGRSQVCRPSHPPGPPSGCRRLG